MKRLRKCLEDVFKCLVTVKIKKKRCILTKNELLWKEKETDVESLNKKFVLAEFLDDLQIDITDIRIDELTKIENN
jgi:hypothetical protein